MGKSEWIRASVTRRSFAIAAILSSVTAAVSAGTLPSGFVNLSSLAPQIAIDIRYARSFNFTDGPVPGYDAGHCILTQQTAQALIKAEALLNAQGYALIVFDCYRPQRAVNFFSDWADQEDLPDQRPAGAELALDSPPAQVSAKDVFFPDFQKSELHGRGFIAHNSGHSVGHTVDVGLRSLGPALAPPDFAAAGRCDGPFETRAAESDLDLGTGYDCFSTLSAYGARISPKAQQNRTILRQAMEKAGFTAYKKEWWHFRNSTDPATGAQNFPVE